MVTIGVLGLFGGLAGGCVVHERAPRYGYYGSGYYGPRHEWRAEERHEEHEEHEHHHW